VSGEEREVVAMFVDLRGSTKMGELHLPYDVLFILDEFLQFNLLILMNLFVFLLW